MKRRWVVAPMLLIIALAALAQPGDGRLRALIRERIAHRQTGATRIPSGDPAARIDSPGDYSFEVAFDGGTRRYRLHVPRSYRHGQPAPLLVALHGGGGDMDWQADDDKYGLISASERHGFIAVFPNGTGALPNGRLATWNAGHCCGRARDRDVDDVRFIRQVVSNVEQQLDIDHRRVYATGMSNGAMMAYQLACEAADVFRAVAPVAGTDNTIACRPSQPVSIAHFHARDDDHVLFDGGAGKAAFGNASAVTDFVSVPATIAKWAALDGCASPVRRVLQRPDVYCDLHENCHDGSRVQVCVTQTGAHSWPGGHKNRGEPASQAISANEAMWSFFESLR